MSNITITTTISQELHNLAKQKEISWHNALARGVRILAGKDEKEGEIKELLEGNNRLQAKITLLSQRIWKLEEEKKRG